jgi:antitoxin StbD
MSASSTRVQHTVSATAMAGSFSVHLEAVTSGAASHLVIFDDDEPAAVLLSVNAYQALLDELEDLRSERLAIERLPGVDTDMTLSLEEMNARFK